MYLQSALRRIEILRGNFDPGVFFLNLYFKLRQKIWFPYWFSYCLKTNSQFSQMLYLQQLQEANQLSRSDHTDSTNTVPVKALKCGGSARNGKWGVALQSLPIMTKLLQKKMNITIDLRIEGIKCYLILT